MTDHANTLTSHAGVTEKPEEVLIAFFVMYKTARLVAPNNATFSGRLDKFLQMLEQASRELGEVTVKTYSDRYFVNDTLVPFDEKKLAGASVVLSEWRTLGIGGITFGLGITPEEAGAFFEFIADMKPTGENLESLREQLISHDLSNIRLLSINEVTPEESDINEEERQQYRHQARKTFVGAMSMVQEIVVCTSQDREINLAKTRRVVQSLVEHVVEDQDSLLELTSIKNFDDYTYAHSTNVSVYALTIGVRLGLDRPRLSQLGFAALFHDIGKVRLPADLVRKPDAFDEDDWIQMQRHPLLGAKTILRSLKLDVHTARAARGAFEHHVNSDFTGYPPLHHHRRQPNLFSKIISICDTFDALSSGRVYLKRSIPVDQVLKKMRYQMQIKFDPFLLRLFNDIVGVYPAGSLVLLDSEELALVLTNNDVDKARPMVKIVGNRDGLFEEPEWANLANPDQSHRNVVRIVDPDRYGLDIRDFILND